jgi:hypothetical protein
MYQTAPKEKPVSMIKKIKKKRKKEKKKKKTNISLFSSTKVAITPLTCRNKRVRQIAVPKEEKAVSIIKKN